MTATRTIAQVAPTLGGLRSTGVYDAYLASRAASQDCAAATPSPAVVSMTEPRGRVATRAGAGGFAWERQIVADEYEVLAKNRPGDDARVLLAVATFS